MYKWNPFTNNLDEKGDWFFGGNTLGSKKTIGSIDNQDFGIITNNSESVTVLKNGNVGIGTTNPTQKLVVNDGNIHINTPNSSFAGNGLRLNRPGATYAGFEIATNNVVDWSIGANYSGFGIYEDGQAATTRLIIKDGGKIGIGTTNPAEKLEVDGNIILGPHNTSVASPSQFISSNYNSSHPRPALVFQGQNNWAGWGVSDFAGGSTHARMGAIKAISSDWGTFGALGSTFNLSIDGGVSIGTATYAPTNGLLVSGNVGIGITTPTAKLDINSDILRLRTAKTPATAGASGNAGDICWDTNYIYVCVATNTWKRTSLETW